MASDAVIRSPVAKAKKSKDRPRKRSRFRRYLRIFLIGCVATLLGTGAFLALRPEGRFTPVDSALVGGTDGIRLLTWNILRSEHEAPLNRPWSERKSAYTAAFSNKEPAYDIVCLQEALPEQIEYFETLLPNHDWYGVGREDGESLGEHCPIFYDRNRFDLLRQGTFWLSPTPDTPSCGWGELFPRLCSWVDLQDRDTDSAIRVMNVHLHLHPLGQIKAAAFLAERVREVDVPLLLVGDMNCPPDWPGMRKLEAAGLREAETSGALTFQLFGKGIRCLDHIFISDAWTASSGGILRGAHEGVSASDHFGLWAACVLVPRP